MTTTLSVRIDAEMKGRLDALAKRARCSRSCLAAEAIAAYLDAEAWRLDQIQTAAHQLDRGAGIPHDAVADWLHSWGGRRERKASRA